jgi:PAS domain-containing protein
MLIFTFGLLRHHLLEAIPIAREYLIENLKDGIVVIDNQNRIVDYNKASETILNMDKHYFARPADYILSALNIPAESLTSQDPTEYELEYRTGDKTMYYNVKVNILYDRLYRSESFSELSAKDYIQSLAHEIMNSYDFDHDIIVNFDIEDFMLQYNVFFSPGHHS